ncbi:N-acetyltransferase GCN5 [Actinoplanes sp. SE50]|uniref:GNAT family N-acetyltransferase n=1 Tax=unclassified Actinoplanes TaxID=2626549 RepID=UPI00023ED054|nr:MULTISPECIES: GNAT family N-acetyltransferase [unclassified Actinoplanes]AEV83858.1 Bifunctional protein NCOAT [Actinoplanes sp. SE50/110]ATO81998.1 N-acetyltransferase GCN5 [Actinoplanes sp. SE50]SLL99406.1 N-acetyltransferase GCN5 [Actinoplanes sp. SE50/110]
MRPYRPADLPALYDICVRTADLGGDARGKYSTDALMGDLFAGPYAVLEPDLAFVLDDGGRAVGYVVGTADTASFVRRYREEWIPRLAGRYPVPPPPPRTPEQDMVALHYRPERMIVPELADHPAHLHIDLLPPYQRRGYGRQLIDALSAAAARAGATGVHLGMVTENVRARPFYDRMGFTVLPVPDPGPLTYLGKRL